MAVDYIIELERFVARQERLLGPNHTEVANTLSRLADLYVASDNLDKAEPLYTRALRIREHAFGRDSVQVSGSLRDLGKLNSMRGNYAYAERYFQWAYAIKEPLLGETHPEVANLLANLSWISQVKLAMLQATD